MFLFIFKSFLGIWPTLIIFAQTYNFCTEPPFFVLIQACKWRLAVLPLITAWEKNKQIKSSENWL